jgi:hypothetical protein
MADGMDLAFMLLAVLLALPASWIYATTAARCLSLTVRFLGRRRVGSLSQRAGFSTGRPALPTGAQKRSVANQLF